METKSQDVLHHSCMVPHRPTSLMTPDAQQPHSCSTEANTCAIN